MSACKRFAAQFSSMLHLLNATSLHGLSQCFHFLKHCTRERFRHKCYSYIGLRRNSHQCYISSMLHLFTDPVSVFIFLKHCARENAFDTSVIVIHHTLHVCLQKVCGAILINATSPQCYISSRTWQDESYACWASKDVKPFPPRILHWSLVVFFRAVEFLPPKRSKSY